MLPKKLHIDEIERFHKQREILNKKLAELKGDESQKELEYSLLRKYMEMNSLWAELDDFIEHTLKHKLDLLKYEENS